MSARNVSTPLRLLAAALALVGLAVGTLAVANPSVLLGFTRRPAQAVGTVVVPDHFVRAWDPVTIFYASDLGLGVGVPEDDPERFVQLSPSHPGAFTWVDRRTLQFRPAEPWPPMADYTWEAGTSSVDLVTLMSPPSHTIPGNGAEDLDPIRAITLTFPQPIEPPALARMTSIELRALPGIGMGDGRWLTSTDFTIKAMERTGPSDPATYVLELDEPIALGTRAVVHFRLSTDDKAEESFAEVSFSTAEPFRPVRVGCRSTTFPVAPEGVRYAEDQAIGCGSGNRTVVVDFSARPGELGPVEGRNLVRFEPTVDGLEYSVHGRRLQVSGNFSWEQLYRVTLAPTPLRDARGRELEMTGESEVYLYFPRRPGYLKWTAARGVVERHGPQMVPLEGRGQERVDLRIHQLDPLDRSLWPFPDSPVQVDESVRPPGPGEEPEAHTDPHRHISTGELYQQLRSLGSPEVSALVDLPLQPEGSAATFGVDLEPHLAFISGKKAPGAYLVGIRSLDGSTSRSWMRIQVTDLSLSTVEEPHAVHLAVTSLSSGKPVAGAQIRLEGTRDPYGEPALWDVLWQGTTRSDGTVRVDAFGRPSDGISLRRIVVQKGADLLVLDPSRPPDAFADNHWNANGGHWLGWLWSDVSHRGPQPEHVTHVFTERPVYRPEEDVYIRGWIRTRHQGRLTPYRPSGWVVVQGPGDLSWRYPTAVSETGGFFHEFHEDDLPTGTYRAWFEDKAHHRYGQVSFKLEAYRIPRFEVELHADDVVPMDREFEVGLVASYYAGGRVAGQPVRWRVTQYPYTWTPVQREGFVYSSDARYSRGRRFEAAPLAEDGVTDAEGGSSLLIDPAVEPTAQPRTYVIEATVTGADDQTVTDTHRVNALPPFVLGLKVPRYLERAMEIRPEVLVAGPEGELLADQELTVRLLHRQWHSYLQASDFSDGEARYVTNVVDEPVLERTVRSVSEPLVLTLPIERSGVYVVEVESRDRLGRAQVVSVDLYAGGDEPVTWAKPKAGVFSVATDQSDYDPGETAHLVLQSPFQTGEALVVVEAPDRNVYQWVRVRGGSGRLDLGIDPTWVPRIPVHVVLMRGRVPGSEPASVRSADLGKPSTVAATTWLKVNPVANRVEVELEHPAKAAPGQTIPVTIELSEPNGEPLSGEVTLWLVDAAVLALGQEQRLDPLPDYITAVRSHLQVRDTRNQVFGWLPYAEMPGGDGAEEWEDDESPLDKATIRQDFRSVPYYEPSIRVGPSGRATVQVKLPDNLTNFKIRAKVAAGDERFGYGKSQVAVRLPVIVQPTLPRFARPGDAFLATAIGRVVEGEGGDGVAAIEAEGVVVDGGTQQRVQLDPVQATRIDFPVQVQTPGYTDEGLLARDELVFTVALERKADEVSDAFRVKLPLRPDRDPERLRVLADLARGQRLELPETDQPARPGTVRRTVLVSDQPALMRMAAGLDFLMRYPYGGTEQRVSKARAYLALGELREQLHMRDGEAEMRRTVEHTLAWLPQVVDGHGLAAHWPGSTGNVALTAWVVQFMVEAREAGFTVDQALLARFTRSLRASLRSDYRWFISGESYYERTCALRALADAGEFDSGYFAELSRRAQYQDVEAVSKVVLAGLRAGQADSSTVARLSEGVADQVVLRLHQGREIYGGFASQRTYSRRIIPSETRTIAEVTRALSRTRPRDDRKDRLVDALITLGRDDGWGSTNANASALLALTEHIEAEAATSPSFSVQVVDAGTSHRLQVDREHPMGFLQTSNAGPSEVTWPEDGPEDGLVWAELTWVPEADGSLVQTVSHGFVVTREQLEQVGEGPPKRIALDQPGAEVPRKVGDVIEEHVQLVNPKDRHFVAVLVPLAAGMEPMNPNLATAPAEARPSGSLTRAPDYAAYLDDHVAFFYETLPKGTYDFYFRTRAAFEGSFVQPPARAEMMYDGAVYGHSSGARVAVERGE